MKEKTDKIITWVLMAVALLCTVLSIVFALNNGGSTELPTGSKADAFDWTYWILWVLVAITIVMIVGFLVVKLAGKFASEKGYLVKFLAIVGVIALICIVSFALSKGNDVSPVLMERMDVSEKTSKAIGAACYAVYILVGLAALAIVGTEVFKSIKKK